MRSKVVVLSFRMLPGFGNIHWHPAMTGLKEIRPAMVARNFTAMLIPWEGKPNLESRRNTLRARHGDKQRMKIRAITPFSVAGIQYVSPSPARPRLVILHI